MKEKSLLMPGLFTLIEAIRRLALKDTELFNASCATIRLALFKIGAIALRNTRRAQMLLSGAYPYKEMFCKISSRLGAAWPENQKINIKFSYQMDQCVLSP
jgi:hypothetical protein